MSSSNPFLGVAHYSLMNAIELFQRGEERHRLGAIILIDLSVESVLKAKLYELKPIGIQQEILDFIELVNQTKIKVPISKEEELKLLKVHKVRNSSQHGGSIPDSFNTCEYLKWASTFVKKFSIDNFGVNVDSKMPLNLRRKFAELTNEKEGKLIDQRYELKEPLDENYETIKNWFKHLDASSRVGSLSDELKKILMNVIAQYSNYVEKDPDQIIEHAKNEFYSTGKQEIHDQYLKDFLDNLPEGKTRITYWSHVRSFYRENEIRTLTTPSPKYQPKRLSENLTGSDIQKICEMANVKHGSWILANSYMGLNVGKIRYLTVEDFHIEKWEESQPIYPVSISEGISHTFPYNTFIGSDAKELLNRYFIENHFGLKDTPWDMIRQDFTTAFRYYSDKAGVTNPHGFTTITSKSLKKRLESILKDAIPHKQWYFVDYLLGRNSEVLPKKLPLLDDVRNAYLKALPKLKVF